MFNSTIDNLLAVFENVEFALLNFLEGQKIKPALQTIKKMWGCTYLGSVRLK